MSIRTEEDSLQTGSPAFAHTENDADAKLTSMQEYLPLYHRPEWLKYSSRSKYRLLSIEDRHGQIFGSLPVQLHSSRVLPGHSFARVLRFGHGLTPAMWHAAAGTLEQMARAEARILRVTVSVFARDGRERIADVFAQHGFRKCEQPLSYRYTRVTDLLPDEAQMLAALDAKARKDLREAAKAGLQVHALTSATFAEALEGLERTAMQRSGGTFRVQDWPSLLRLSANHPELSRIGGLFPQGTAAVPENLVAFAWGCMHGDHAENRSAGTLRLPNTRVSLSSPLLWDLILWAKRQGATWFDLGGVTPAAEPDERLQGISNFKRRFGPTVVEVGEDWALEAHPRKIRLATTLGKVAGRVAALRRSKGDGDAG